MESSIVKIALERQGLYAPAGVTHSLTLLANWIDTHVKSRIHMWVLDADIDAVFCGCALPAGCTLLSWIHLVSGLRTGAYRKDVLCALLVQYQPLKKWAETPVVWGDYTHVDNVTQQFLYTSVEQFQDLMSAFENTLTDRTARKQHSKLVANIVNTEHEFNVYELTCLMLNLGYTQNILMANAPSAKITYKV